MSGYAAGASRRSAHARCRARVRSMPRAWWSHRASSTCTGTAPIRAATTTRRWTASLRRSSWKWEFLQMFRLAAAYDAAGYVHIRGASSAGSADREQGLLEAIALAAVSGAGVHIAHINSSGQSSAPRMLDIIRDAQAHGVDVTTE